MIFMIPVSSLMLIFSLSPTPLYSLPPPSPQLISSLSLLSKDQLQRSLLLGGLATWQPVPPIAEPRLAAHLSGVTSAAVGALHGPLLVPLTVGAAKW